MRKRNNKYEISISQYVVINNNKDIDLKLSIGSSIFDCIDKKRNISLNIDH